MLFNTNEQEVYDKYANFLEVARIFGRGSKGMDYNFMTLKNTISETYSRN